MNLKFRRHCSALQAVREINEARHGLDLIFMPRVFELSGHEQQQSWSSTIKRLPHLVAPNLLQRMIDFWQL